MSNINWALDPSHSEIIFKIKHLMITTVSGQFKKFNVEVETAGDDFNSATKIAFTADVDSVSTNDNQRDGHLKSADFFDAEKFPQLTFISNKYEADGNDGKVTGELTMHGVTKPITLNVEFGGIVKDLYGQTKAGFTIAGKLSRKEFDLTWGAVTEAGNVLLGDEVKIQAEIQLIKKADQLVDEKQLA
ncbi:MAG: YceI family protein [Ginsengibacter sp.]